MARGTGAAGTTTCTGDQARQSIKKKKPRRIKLPYTQLRAQSPDRCDEPRIRVTNWRSQGTNGMGSLVPPTRSLMGCILLLLTETVIALPMMQAREFS